jgi:DNA-binding CsgD family transcriptional regulator
MAGGADLEPGGGEDEVDLVAARTDPEAFVAFYDRRYSRVATFFYRRILCPFTTAELTAETFARVWASRDRFDPAKGTASGWTMGIASNLYRQWSQKGSVEQIARNRLSVRTPDLVLEDLVPEEYRGKLLISVGVKAKPGEPYGVGTDALAAGEPLACRALIGLEVADVPKVDGVEVRVSPEGVPTAPIAVDDPAADPSHVARRPGPHLVGPVRRAGGPCRTGPVGGSAVLTPPRSARIDIGSTVVRLALRFVVAERGWAECGHEGRCGCVTVSDRLPAGAAPLDVLIVRDEPAACQDAIEAAVAARVRAVVLWNEPEGLAAACEGLGSRMAMIPHRVLELGALAPRLTQRQRDTLRLLAKGSSSTLIAGALCQSESTAKRDIADLLQVFDVPNRTALVSSAASLGFVPAPQSLRCPRPGAAPEAALAGSG